MGPARAAGTTLGAGGHHRDRSRRIRSGPHRGRRDATRPWRANDPALFRSAERSRAAGSHGTVYAAGASVKMTRLLIGFSHRKPKRPGCFGCRTMQRRRIRQADRCARPIRHLPSATHKQTKEMTFCNSDPGKKNPSGPCLGRPGWETICDLLTSDLTVVRTPTGRKGTTLA